MRDGPEKKLNLLFASSSRLASRGILERLEKLGHTVHLVEQTDQVLSEVKRVKPEILVLILEPQENCSIIDLIKTHPETHSTAIILVSDRPELSQVAISAGANTVLHDPFGDEELRDAIDKARPRRKKVLIVDDSKTIHQVLESILKDDPFDVFHAFDGQEGCILFESTCPDLVVTDIEMPHMNGYELCKWIKSHQTLGRTPVIVLSSLSTGADIDQGFDVGADDYLVKPVDHEEFLSKVRTCLSSGIKRQRDLILVVDDSRLIQGLVGNALEMQGFRTKFADNGAEGLYLVKACRPAMVITDCDMPLMNGRDFVREIRSIQEFKHLPILMLTAKDSQVEKAKARKAGVSEFVSKPFTADKILVIVERLLAEGKILREREAMMTYMSEAAIKQARERAQLPANNSMTAFSDHAAILFVDICGFTAMSEKLSPDIVIKFLNSYFDAMVPIINEWKGIIDKFIGDGIMAVFHGSSPETNALRAVTAAHRMIERLKKFHSPVLQDKPQIHVRIGVNSGSVIFGDLGSQLSRRDFTVIGDNVNTAQRLQAAALPGSVLLSDSTYVLIKDRIVISETHSLRLKGKEIEIVCHRLQDVPIEYSDKKTA